MTKPGTIFVLKLAENDIFELEVNFYSSHYLSGLGVFVVPEPGGGGGGWGGEDIVSFKSMKAMRMKPRGYMVCLKLLPLRSA